MRSSPTQTGPKEIRSSSCVPGSSAKEAPGVVDGVVVDEALVMLVASERESLEASLIVSSLEPSSEQEAMSSSLRSFLSAQRW